MIKKTVSLLMSIILIFSVFTIIPVSAAETDESAVGGYIKVKAPVGDSDHPFNGVFDGNGKSLLDLSSEDGNFAPFIKTSGNDTVIKNLIVKGNISFSKKCGSALVARAAAQRYFDFSTEDLANSILDPDERVYRNYNDFEIEPSDNNLPNGVFKGASLSLKSQTTLSIYFKNDNPLTFSCGDETVEKATVDGYQVARIRNIPAVKLSDTFTLTVNGQYEVHCSPLNYCKKALTTDSLSNNLKNVAGSLYTYSLLADFTSAKSSPRRSRIDPLKSF